MAESSEADRYLLKRIAAGDAAGARKAVEDHIRHTGDRLVAYGESMQRSEIGSVA